MENLYRRMRQLKIIGKLPQKSEINSVLSSFSKKEWLIFIILAAMLFLSTIAILQSINTSLMVKVPARGGSISEGIIGVPRFVNPVLANSPADRDLVSLIYSGLMRKNTDGNLIPDLAKKVEASKNGLSYIFTLKDELYFHDGKPVTADDVLFTIKTIKDSVIKNPQKGNWGSIGVQKIDEKTIKFTLKQAYGLFLENTTLGIMPKHLWDNSPIELNEANTNPIGSGPYFVSKVNKQSSGIIDRYELTAFNRFTLGKPYIKKINLRFYSNEDDMIAALEKKEVSQINSITPLNAKILSKKYLIYSAVLPRVFGLFFNQNQNQIFTDKNIVKAINLAINKDRIVEEVLAGYGVAIDGPIPPNLTTYQKLKEKNGASHEEILKKAQAVLIEDGWKIGQSGFLEKTMTEKKKKVAKILEFSISTGNVAELAKSALLVKQDLTALGMKVDIKTFEVGNLNQNVIRPRKYDALLFGQIINTESDLSAFWHSSQRKDPGLNVAMYTNAKVDKILEDAYTTIDKKSRTEKYTQFAEEIKKDMPAVFLYSPYFIYIAPKNLQGLAIDNTTFFPADRFLNVYLWYTETDNIWKIFLLK